MRLLTASPDICGRCQNRGNNITASDDVH